MAEADKQYKTTRENPSSFPRAGGFRIARAFDNYFFSAMALLVLATVFWGLARSYFLAGVRFQTS
jgi:hypothetical protein